MVASSGRSEGEEGTPAHTPSRSEETDMLSLYLNRIARFTPILTKCLIMVRELLTSHSICFRQNQSLQIFYKCVEKYKTADSKNKKCVQSSDAG